MTEPTAAEKPGHMLQTALRILDDAATGGISAVSARLARYSYEDDGGWLYLACVAWAETARRMSWPGDWQVSFERDGERLNAEDAGPDAALQVWAVRFLAAHANGDHDMVLALWRVQAGREDLIEAVGSLLLVVADMVRQWRARPRPGN